MIDLPVFLDIAIGLFFIYLTLSLLASEIQELFAGFFQWRAKHLKKSIYRMLSGVNNGRKIEAALKTEKDRETKNIPGLDSKDKNIVELVHKLYSHYEIASLSQSSLGFISKTKNQYGPSYIPAASFAIAFIDVLTDELKTNDGDLKASKYSSFLNKLIEPNAENSGKYYFETIFLAIPRLKSYLSTLAKKILVAEGIPESEEINADFFQRFPSFMNQFQLEIEDWFQHSQDRTSGTYKRNSKILLFGVGLLAALLANANTFQIVKNLHDEDIRETIVTRAIETSDICQDEPADIAVCLDEIDAALQANELPIGGLEWVDNQLKINDLPRIIFYDIFGMVVTAFAIMMGAPFWFDLLKKVVNVRNAGPKPRTSDSVRIENQKHLVE